MTFLNSSISLGNDSVYLNKDTKAPFSGYLLPHDTVLKFRNMELKNKELTLNVESFERTVDIYKRNEDASEKQNKLLLERTDTLAKELASARSTSNFERALYVVLGAFAMYGAYQVAK